MYLKDLRILFGKFKKGIVACRIGFCNFMDREFAVLAFLTLTMTVMPSYVVFSEHLKTYNRYLEDDKIE